MASEITRNEPFLPDCAVLPPKFRTASTVGRS